MDGRRRRAQGQVRRRAELAAIAGSALLVLIGLSTVRAGPAHGAAGLPSLPVSLPSLTVSLPSLPLPSLPVVTPTLPLPTPTLPRPSLPLPSLPVATPSLVLPTPTVPLPSLPLPSLPVPTGSNGGPPSAFPSGATGPSGVPTTAGSIDPTGSGFAGPGGSGSATPSQGGIAVPVEPPQPPNGGDGALQLIVPGLIAGIPILVVILVVFAQAVGGVAWLPLVRRWLNRRLIPGVERRLP